MQLVHQNVFVFDAAYLADENRPVLSLSFYDAYRALRTEVRPVTRRMPPFYSNLLPQRQLRQLIAEHGDVNSQRECLLLWLLGNELSGGCHRSRDRRPRTSARLGHSNLIAQQGQQGCPAIVARRCPVKGFGCRGPEPTTLYPCFQAGRTLDRETAVSRISTLARERILYDGVCAESRHTSAGGWIPPTGPD
jgi:HipA-like protein